MIGVTLRVAAKTIRSGGMQGSDSPQAVPDRRRSSIPGELASGVAPGPSDLPPPGFGKQAEKVASMKGIISLSHL